MFMQILKLIWNRKQSSALIIAEVSICFIVAFTLLSTAIYNFRLYMEPLGFNWQNIWNIEARSNGFKTNAQVQPQLQQISKMLNNQQKIVSAKILANPPFTPSRTSSESIVNGVKVETLKNSIESGSEAILGLKLLDGRFFNEQDINQNYRPVLISRRYKSLVYPNESALGKTTDYDGSENGRHSKIVGVFEEFRQMGEFSDLKPYLFSLYDVNMDKRHHRTHFMVKLELGVNAADIEPLLRQLHGIAPEWNFRINSWRQLRQAHIRGSLVPISIFFIISLFLILMVGLGLFGVLWQNISRRTAEIGLRRALGATGINIQSQVISELLMITSLGVLLGILVVIQLPLLGVFKPLDWTTFGLGLAASVGLMLSLALLCAYYPSRIAAAHSPAMALRHEC